MANIAAFMNPAFLTNFIEAYRSFTCLWKVKSADYSNKFKRQHALNQLVNLTKETIPDADLGFVKKRIDTLRGSFRKELNKVRESKKSGMSSDSVHLPKLWYYDLMLFTVEQEVSRIGKSSMGEMESELEEEEPTEDPNSGVTKEAGNEEALPEVMSATTPSTNRKRHENQIAEERRQKLVKKAFDIIDKQEDEYDALGKTVAAKIRKMNCMQRIHADKLINDVCYKGLLNELSSSTSIVDKKIEQQWSNTPSPQTSCTPSINRSYTPLSNISDNSTPHTISIDFPTISDNSISTHTSHSHLSCTSNNDDTVLHHQEFNTSVVHGDTYTQPY